MTRKHYETLALIAALGLALVALATWPPRVDTPVPVRTATPTPIVAPVHLGSLLAAGASAIRAPGASTAGDEPARGSAAADVRVEGVSGGRNAPLLSADGRPAASTGGFAAPSTAPLQLSMTPDALPDFAALEDCGVPCWGERMTRAEVEALALAVTGDAAWSAWAGACFAAPGRESGGYVGAVGGPNRDGSWDVGLAQMNTVHGAWADIARVLQDPGYALQTAYALYARQGAGAWLGCRGGE